MWKLQAVLPGNGGQTRRGAACDVMLFDTGVFHGNSTFCSRYVTGQGFELYVKPWAEKPAHGFLMSCGKRSKKNTQKTLIHFSHPTQRKSKRMTYDLFLALCIPKLTTGKMTAQRNTYRQLSKSLKQTTVQTKSENAKNRKNLTMSFLRFFILPPSKTTI